MSYLRLKIDLFSVKLLYIQYNIYMVNEQEDLIDLIWHVNPTTYITYTSSGDTEAKNFAGDAAT